MKSRLFVNNALPTIPDEVMIPLLDYLTNQELVNTSLVSRDFYRLANDEILWKHRFIRDHGEWLLIGKTDIKAQYIAATLYKTAKRHTRPDLAQQVFVQLYRLAKPHQGKLWANYYLGHLYHNGFGTIKAVAHGRLLLLQCANDGHAEAINDCLDLFKENIEALHPAQCLHYLHRLTEAYHLGAKHVCLNLARLSHFGTSESRKLDMEILWLERALLLSEEGEQAAYQDAMLRAVELHHLPALVESGNAALEEALHTHEPNERELLETLALEYFNQGLRDNHIPCTQGYYDRSVRLIETTRTTYEPLLEKLTDAFRQGNPIAAILMCNLQASLPGFSLIRENMDAILWLQLAAQCGKLDAVDQLTVLATQHSTDVLDQLSILGPQNSPSVYALCALAIIHEFGILGSSKHPPQPKEALKYLQKALELDHEKVKRYLETGRDLRLLSSRMIEIMQTHYATFMKRNSGCTLL